MPLSDSLGKERLNQHPAWLGNRTSRPGLLSCAAALPVHRWHELPLAANGSCRVLLKLADGAESESTRVKALELCGRELGMFRDPAAYSHRPVQDDRGSAPGVDCVDWHPLGPHSRSLSRQVLSPVRFKLGPLQKLAIRFWRDFSLG